jgi:hypothetical protein
MIPPALGFLALTIVMTVPMAPDPIFRLEQGRTFGRELLWGNPLNLIGSTESAAFVVDRGDGGIVCLVWPTTRQHHQQTFYGATPPGTIAIIHTHPPKMPMPSPIDQIESHRLGIPIYVITPGLVTKAVPYSPLPIIVERGKWW